MAAFNQSRIKTFRRCQKQYSFRYDTTLYGGKRGQEMIPKQKKLPLYRGSWMHALQEALHYQWAGFEEFAIDFGEGRNVLEITAVSWEDVHAALTDQFNSLFEEEREDLGDLPDECERLFRSYLRFWKHDRDLYSVAEVNGEPAIELIVEAPLSKFGVGTPFKGKIDLIVEDDEYGGLWVWDAKWVKRIPAPDERMMSPQALLYVWALRTQYDLDVKGFVFNYGRTKAPAIPRVLKRPAGMLSTAHRMDTDRYTYIQAIKDAHGEDWKKYLSYYREKLDELRGREAMWFDRARVPVEDERVLRALREFVVSIKDINDRETRQDYIPRSYFYNCKFGCDYHSPCVAEFQGLDVEALIKSDYEFTGERYKEVDLLDA